MDQEMDFSWRLDVLSYLLCSIIIQIRNICWAISYVRQLEFLLKKNGLMPLGEHLSIQDFLDRIPKDRDLLESDGTARDFTMLGRYLELGVCLESQKNSDNQDITGTIEADDQLVRYRATMVYVHDYGEYIAKYGEEEAYQRFHNKLESLIKNKGVVTVRIPLYDSYYDLQGKDIFYPTAREWNGPEPKHAHIMVAVGCSRVKDITGQRYYECQESCGTNVCDEGHVRIIADLVTHFVEMTVGKECLEETTEFVSSF